MSRLDRFGDWLVTSQLIAEEDRELHLYGLKQGLLLVLNTGSLLILAGLMDLLWQSILILAAYYPLRTYAGGYHAKTPVKCYVSSLALMGSALVLMKRVVWSAEVLLVTTFMAMAVLLWLAPLESTNKLLSSWEYWQFRRKSLHLGTWILGLVLLLLGGGWTEWAACLNLSLVAVSLLLLLGFATGRLDTSYTGKTLQKPKNLKETLDKQG